MVTHIPPPSNSAHSLHLPFRPSHPFPPTPPSSQQSSQSGGPLPPPSSQSIIPYPPPHHPQPPPPPPQSTRAPSSTALTSLPRTHHRHRPSPPLPPPLGQHLQHSSSRAPPSSASASSFSFSQRQAATKNEFPWFAQTGDVEIVLKDKKGSGRREKRYMLHGWILAQNSGWFHGELGKEEDEDEEEERGTAGNYDAPAHGWEVSRIVGDGGLRSPGDARRRRYELDWADQREGIFPMLVRMDPAQKAVFSTPPRPLPPRNKPPPPQASFFRNMAANLSTTDIASATTHTIASEEDDLLTAYDNLFRIFYNHNPHLDTLNIATAYVECKALLALAASYDALPVVGTRVDHHLLRFQSRLWKQVAKYPPSYLKLGHLARSRAIFSEAIIHVVGQWPAGATQLRRGMVDDAVLDLIEDKVDEMEEARARTEARLFRVTLTTSRGDRVTPANAYADWLAVSLFRQWVAENTTPAPVGILKDTRSAQAGPGTYSNQESPRSGFAVTPSTGRIYRLLGTGGQAYLGHDELKRFLKMRPEEYTRDGLRRFERRMEELKHLAMEVVKPLTRNFLELDLGGLGAGGLPYLTCTRLVDGDFGFVWGERE